MLDLTSRQRQILKSIVDNYIATAEPVGSKLLAEMRFDKLSPATIRNEMSELESLGYIEKPHTSSGRVPSPLGYRLYVDELMAHYRNTSSEISKMQSAIAQKSRELERTLEVASAIISEMTNQAAVSLSTRHKKFRVKKIEFIPIDENSYALVGITVPHAVTNRIIHVSDDILPDEIAALCRAINTILQTDGVAGIYKLLEIAEIRPNLLLLLNELISFLEALEVEQDFSDISIQGAAKLLGNPEYYDTNKARDLLDLLSDKEKMFELARTQIPKTINIKIGPENGADAARDASFVFTVCEMGGGVQGIIGVIGPTRMNYECISSQLSLLKHGFNSILPPGFPRKNE